MGRGPTSSQPTVRVKREAQWVSKEMQMGLGIQVPKYKRNAQRVQWAREEAGSGPTDWARRMYSYVFNRLGIG